jgi:beta-RFAP synthase
MTQAVQTTPQRQVAVETTARLHMGFIDLHGGLGRRFGSIGLSLDQPVTRFRVWPADTFSASGSATSRVVEVAERFARQAGLRGGARFEVDSLIPEHAGLGSGTQLALAVGMALSRLYNLGLKPAEVAAFTGRGMRSGIGIGAFELGGLLVDGGRAPDTQVPPVVARLDFPEAWRVLLVCDAQTPGVHGKQEVQAFGELPEFPAQQAAHIARLVLMQALPAVAERDLENFGRAISELQRIVGDHFAPAQGGGRYISRAVAETMAWMETQGVPCVGQSSWGPTGFAVVENAAVAEQLLQAMRQRNPSLQYHMCAARNSGSLVADCSGPHGVQASN